MEAPSVISEARSVKTGQKRGAVALSFGGYIEDTTSQGYIAGILGSSAETAISREKC